ncbi:hypothetical protein SmJEL517_g05991 [Synchytrium microbalum]|uniref:Uncharacterized protein n=1 Tax=Synchytrium microbalum TaxID=1806994 RepID=A0A507BYN1_9FUNG|nr:uncharacterized protein SmJEL517_g05991 [Synchytrium microbalum]TPX30445.1 hypothetical protein SmJEL517_g05991 [Synchytrium microbalum]
MGATTLQERLFEKTPCCNHSHRQIEEDEPEEEEYESKHSLFKDKEHLESFNADGSKKDLWDMFITPASITTMETKFGVMPNVAEFYCTITSIFFCAPLLIYNDIPYELVPPLQRACIALACITAVASFAYHMTIWKVLSSADSGLAVATMFLNAHSLNSSLAPPSSWLHNDLSWQVPLTAIILLFIWHWERTAILAVKMILVIFPWSVYGYIRGGAWTGMILGVAGLACFAVDRKGWFPGHTWWHIGGGLSLYYAIHAATQKTLLTYT